MRILTFLVFAINVVYATPILHTNFAYRFLDHHFLEYTEKEAQEFILGVLYPDVRYLQVIDREVTHEFDVQLADVLAADTPFLAGIKLHCFIDELRDRHIEETGIYERLARFPQENINLFLKLIEDEMLYSDQQSNFAKKCLDEVITEEFLHGLTLHTMRTWHRVLSQYFSNPPGTILRRLRQFGLGLFGVDSEEIALWSRSLSQIVTTEDFQEYMEGLSLVFNQEIAEK